MDVLYSSYADHAQFPKNLILSRISNRSREAYTKRLTEHERRLFDIPEKAAVHLIELEVTTTDLKNVVLSTSAEVHDALWDGYGRGKEDPMCRMFFLHAMSSRSRLYITRDMLGRILSYHQVMPNYLDNIFPFGHQEFPIDSHFGGFRYQQTMKPRNETLRVDGRGRSGIGFQHCFSLKSIESKSYQKDDGEWPWTMRETAVHHSFDVVNGKSVWVVLKADDLMRQQFHSIVNARSQPTRSEAGHSFALTLELQSALCEWAGENWRWYINFLEQRLQNLTRSALFRPVTPASAPRTSRRRTKAQTLLFMNDTDLEEMRTERSRRNVFSLMLRSLIGRSERMSFNASVPMEKVGSTDLQLRQHPEYDAFSFEDIQDIQEIEEKANEAKTVLSTNIIVIEALISHYSSAWNEWDMPDAIKAECADDFFEFRGRLKAIRDDLQMNLQLLQDLLRLVTDRKGLSNNILTVQNMEASKQSAYQAQDSAEKVEDMTKVMFELTRDMKREAIAMKVIALVTMVFLPGTFISTLMSAGIVNFTTSNQNIANNNFSLGALQFFFATSLPLMALTFAVYGIWHWWSRKSEQLILAYLRRREAGGDPDCEQ